jgi:hypothetical protein
MSAVATVQSRPTAAVIESAGWSVEERALLRWGGLAGLFGGLIFIGVFVIVGVFIGADPSEPAGAIARFPDIRMARTFENGLYMLVLVLWTVHALALYRALRPTSLAPALFGTGVLLLGIGLLATGAIPHAATAPIADLYRTSSASEQAALVPVWQASQAMFNALLVEGLIVLPIGLALLGLAMLGAPSFGLLLGWVGIGLGVVAAGAGVALLVDPMSAVAVLGVLSLIVFHLVVGWRIFRLSQTTAASRPHAGTPTNRA